MQQYLWYYVYTELLEYVVGNFPIAAIHNKLYMNEAVGYLLHVIGSHILSSHQYIKFARELLTSGRALLATPKYGAGQASWCNKKIHDERRADTDVMTMLYALRPFHMLNNNRALAEKYQCFT
jgi:hypothetical protein